ncbi:MAG: hypothetical protein M3Q70_00330 [bacterium]|nr:hypothetical protein [bacterium]
MDHDATIESIDFLINRVNNIVSISAGGMKDTDFPDKVIASLHNHLGNAKHMVNDMTAAFNATDQFLSIKAAEKELDEAAADLLELHQHSLLNDWQYQHLAHYAHDLQDLLSNATDTEFMGE